MPNYYTLPKVDCSRGAPMGRTRSLTDPEGAVVNVSLVRMDKEGYDTGGAYWGLGLPLYMASHNHGEGGLTFCRAIDNLEAIYKFKKEWPSGNFRNIRRMRKRRYKYSKEIIRDMDEDDFAYDPWGTTRKWLYDICAILWNRGYRVEGYSPGGNGDVACVEECGPLLEDHPTDALLYMERVLSRYSELLIRHDKDY